MSSPSDSGSGLRVTTASRLTSEFIGTAFLLLSAVGSGIMAQRLSPGDVGLQLLQNAAATAGALTCLILMFGATSGAHFNPVVTLWARTEGDLDTAMAGLYVLAQVVGGIAGTVAANLIFDLDAVFWSTHHRATPAHFASEVIATFGLVLVIIGVVRSTRSRSGPPLALALAVAAYIGGAYFFTSSSSFANPAVSIARTFSDTFAGMAPASAPWFIAAQLLGALAAIATARITHPRP